MQNQERYQIGAHQNGSSGFYYTVQDLQQGSVQVVCSEEVMPLGVRRQRAKRMAEQAAFEARMFTLQGEMILSLPGASDYRDGYEWWTGYDLNERDRRLTPEEQYAAGRWLLLPGGSGGQARHVDDIVDGIQHGGRAGKRVVHRNSLEYVGETHVYRIKGANGTHKIGESAQGTRVCDGASIRGEQQARRLTRETGDLYRSKILKTFSDKRSARDYETRLIERYRRIFGDDTLPGNITNR